MDKKLYVCGFLFSLDRSRVCLIRKAMKSKDSRKDLSWMDDQLNGVGGKVNPGEHPDDAMRREFLEEAGADVWGWNQYASIEFDDCIVYFYRIFSGSIEDVKTMTDEEIIVEDVEFLLSKQGPVTVNNLSWLVPLALDATIKNALVIGKSLNQ